MTSILMLLYGNDTLQRKKTHNMSLLPLRLCLALPRLTPKRAYARYFHPSRNSALRLLLGLATVLWLTGCQSTGAPAIQTQNTTEFPGPTDSNRSAVQGYSDNTNRLVPPQSLIPWEENIHPLFLQARTLVEQQLDADLRTVQLLLVGDSPINDEVNRETRRLVNEQFGTSHFADRFLNRVMKAQSGTYAALFTARLNAVMVSRSMLASYERSLPQDSQIRNAALLTLLIHELVHAADDQRYRIHEKRALNFRASFAQSATFEGHAQWVTRQICADNNCLQGLEALDNFMFSRVEQSNQLTQPVEAISRNVLEYSYVEGERFIANLAERSGGEQLIDALLRSPPYDPIQILAPDSYPDHLRERRNTRLVRASLDVDHPWVRDQWIGVETSPLKGVNLRADPSRRQAAVDGFTRLIEAMVAMQLYNRAQPESSPMEVTLLQAESANTARLFARTLHENSQLANAYIEEEPLRINTGAGNVQSQMSMHMFRTTVDSDKPFRTVIGVSGNYVVQIAGLSTRAEPLNDYAIRVLLNLQLPR